MRKSVFALVAVFMLLGAVGLQAEKTAAPKAVLQKGDMEKFIKTFPAMAKELYDLGVQFDEKNGAADVPKALAADASAKAMLKKYGWDDKFYVKMQVIMSGLFLIMYEQSMQDANPEMEKAIKEIQDSPDLSAAQKKQMTDQLRQAMSSTGTQGKEAKAAVHKNDLDLIKPHVKTLMKMFEDIQDENKVDSEADDGSGGDDSGGSEN